MGGKIKYRFHVFSFCLLILCDILYFKTDNSDRAFFKELAKVIEVSDVILEVLDARDPLGTRCIDMEKMVMKAGPDKHLVLLLNKIGNVFTQYLCTSHPCINKGMLSYHGNITARNLAK